MICPSCALTSLPPEIRGRRECRMRNAPAALRANEESTQASHHRYAETIRRIQTVVATPRFHSCQQLVKRFRWCSPAERLSRPGIESRGHCGYLVHAVDAQVCGFREVLPQQPVGVLVCAALPRASWIAKVDLDSRIDLEDDCAETFRLPDPKLANDAVPRAR